MQSRGQYTKRFSLNTHDFFFSFTKSSLHFSPVLFSYAAEISASWPTCFVAEQQVGTGKWKGGSCWCEGLGWRKYPCMSSAGLLLNRYREAFLFWPKRLQHLHIFASDTFNPTLNLIRDWCNPGRNKKLFTVSKFVLQRQLFKMASLLNSLFLFFYCI
jgi:hypothetical protein